MADREREEQEEECANQLCHCRNHVVADMIRHSLGKREMSLDQMTAGHCDGGDQEYSVTALLVGI